MPGIVYDTYGLASGTGDEIIDFTNDITFTRIPLFCWIEVTTQGTTQALVCELSGDPEGTSRTYNIAQSREYPFRIRKILSTTAVTKVIPMYGGPD